MSWFVSPLKQVENFLEKVDGTVSSTMKKTDNVSTPDNLVDQSTVKPVTDNNLVPEQRPTTEGDPSSSAAPPDAPGDVPQIPRGFGSDAQQPTLPTVSSTSTISDEPTIQLPDVVEPTVHDSSVPQKPVDQIDASNDQKYVLLQERATTLASECDRLDQRVVELEKTLHQKNSSLSALNAIVDDLKRSKSDLEKLLDAHSSTRQQSQSRISQLESAISEYSNALALAHKDLDTKSKETEKVALDFADLKYAKRMLQEEFNSYKAKASLALQSQEGSVKTLTEKLSSLQMELEAERAQRAQLQTQQEVKIVEPVAVSVIPSISEETIAKSEAEIKVLKQHILELEAENLRRDAELSSLKDEADKWKRECDRNQARVTDAESRMETLRRQSAAKALAISQTPPHPSHPSADISQLEARLRSMTEQLQFVLADNTRLRQEATAAENRDTVSITVTDKHSLPAVRLNSLNGMIQRSHLPFPVQSVLDGPTLVFDNACSYIGRLLRNYPLFRLLVVVYITVLHCWIFLLFARWGPPVTPDGAGQEGPHQ